MGIIKTYNISYLDRNFIKACKELPFVTSGDIYPTNKRYLAQGAKLWKAIETNIGVDIDLATVINAYADATENIFSELRGIIDELIRWKNSAAAMSAIEKINYTIANIIACDDSTIERFMPYDVTGLVHPWINGRVDAQSPDQFTCRDKFYERVAQYKDSLSRQVSVDEAEKLLEDINEVTMDAHCYIRSEICATLLRALEASNDAAYRGDIYKALQANLQMGAGNKRREWNDVESIMVSLYGMGYSMSLAQYVMIATFPTFRAS